MVRVRYSTVEIILAQTSVSKGRDVPQEILVLLSLCPGTRAKGFLPGQTPLSRDVLGQNQLCPKNQKTGKGRSKTRKEHSKTEKDVLKQKCMF